MLLQTLGHTCIMKVQINLISLLEDSFTEVRYTCIISILLVEMLNFSVVLIDITEVAT